MDVGDQAPGEYHDGQLVISGCYSIKATMTPQVRSQKAWMTGRELWRRIALSLLISNTDDHLFSRLRCSFDHLKRRAPWMRRDSLD